jgi:transcriptional regulator with XRE-family HTH domain
VNGRVYPRMNKIEKIAKYFGITISDLVEKHSIEDKPSEMAILHAQMIQDEDLNQLYVYYKSLNSKKRTIVFDLVRSLAED